MTITYAGITDRPGFSSAFQAFVNLLRLPRQRRNNGNALVAVDLAERPTVTHTQTMVATLTARIETLEAEFAKVEAAAAAHRADFERERERSERLMAEVLKATAELMAAREATARIAGELAAMQARPCGAGWLGERHGYRLRPISPNGPRGARGSADGRGRVALFVQWRTGRGELVLNLTGPVRALDTARSLL
jgi:hypothetical protein